MEGGGNSGLIVGEDGQTLVVDTLFTGALTQDMLDAYARAEPSAANIDVLAFGAPPKRRFIFSVLNIDDSSD